MAEVKVLIEGCLSEDNNGHFGPTMVLIKDGDTNIIVDPGSVSEQKIIVEKLKKEGLAVDDIKFVFITHSHLDHYKNIGMFPCADALDYLGWWVGDTWVESDGNISKDIKMIKTPGHSSDSVTFLVKTEKGFIAICGDVIFNEKYLKESKNDPYANEKESLKESRKKVLEIADYIIPGHGKMFKVKK